MVIAYDLGVICLGKKELTKLAERESCIIPRDDVTRLRGAASL